jgi:hypothetical protein
MGDEEVAREYDIEQYDAPYLQDGGRRTPSPGHIGRPLPALISAVLSG